MVPYQWKFTKNFHHGLAKFLGFIKVNTLGTCLCKQTACFSTFKIFYSGTQDIEFEWLIGPIPIGDSIGKEIVAKYDVKFDTKESFFTDSNGRQMLKRTRNYRPTWKLDVTEPVSANYFPVNSRIFVRDENDQQATVLTDRSQGGTSMSKF